MSPQVEQMITTALRSAEVPDTQHGFTIPFALSFSIWCNYSYVQRLQCRLHLLLTSPDPQVVFSIRYDVINFVSTKNVFAVKAPYEFQT
jgi:hypothetical protein